MLVLANERDQHLDEGMSNKVAIACVHEVHSSNDNKVGFVVIVCARTPSLLASLRWFKDPS